MAEKIKPSDLEYFKQGNPCYNDRIKCLIFQLVAEEDDLSGQNWMSFGKPSGGAKCYSKEIIEKAQRVLQEREEEIF